MMKYYPAHWGALLILMSSLLTALCLGLALVVFERQGALGYVGYALLALVVVCALFTIRGYFVTPDAVLVQRLLWTTRLPLAGLQSVQLTTLPVLMGIRMGNGGFFSFTGWRYSPSIGFYRVFVTDHRKAVVLRFSDRTVAVSPTAPDQFVQDLAVASQAPSAD